VREPGAADVEFGPDPCGCPRAEALLVVYVVQALTLAVVGPHLERDQPKLVELVFVAHAGTDVVRQESTAGEQVVRLPGEQSLAAAALDARQVVG
jgi:hypothetical protein